MKSNASLILSNISQLIEDSSLIKKKDTHYYKHMSIRNSNQEQL